MEIPQFKANLAIVALREQEINSKDTMKVWYKDWVYIAVVLATYSVNRMAMATAPGA